MSVKRVLAEYEKAEIRGHIPQGTAAKMTLATILEAGASAFHQAYFGNAEWAKAIDNARTAQHESENNAMAMAEHLITDISQVTRTLGAIHTTSDFPLALAQIRDRVRRQSYNPVESTIYSLARRRTATDFKPLRGIRTDVFDRLPVRPEGTSVTYASFGSTEDLYRVANYELAIAYTWESWVNDDIAEFTTALANLGVAARRTRALITFEAIKSITRTTLSGTNEEGTAAAGGPTPANVVAANQLLAEQTNADGNPMPRLLTDIAIPAKWRTTAAQTLESEHVVAGSGNRQARRNAAFGLAERLIEPMMAEVNPGSTNAVDWIAFDRSQEWLEFAALSGYEAGPRTFTKMPDVVETSLEGSFDNKSLAVKVSDNVGAKVVDPKSVLLIAGA